MSFFRNIRSSITRGKSSSRDTTPVRTPSVHSSRPGSIVSNAASSIGEGRRDSMDSRGDSTLNRGETFILNSDQEDKNHSNSSTLEKKSKKSKVLSKFSTFTKRKKTPPADNESCEHHPSDNATNTYYKWSTDGSGSIADYDAQSDPFNFLYEQHSNLKLLKNGIDSADIRGGGGGGGSGATKNHGLFDSSTYRKGKASTQLKAQLEQLKTQHSADLQEEEPELEGDKYKTVTLNSFRKSFRDKYLQQQKDAAYNPAWFIEVDSPEKSDSIDRQDSKENRPEYLVFENDNYRPSSRSPVRDRSAASDGRNSRSTTRSPVKRNETFRVERSSIADITSTPTSASTPTPTPMLTSTRTATPTQYNTASLQRNSTPSIRVEIKNSVLPHITGGRIVPVGVAKPMPSTQSNVGYYRSLTTATPISHTASHTITTPSMPTTARIRGSAISPLRGSHKPISITTSLANPAAICPGRYQTLVQISNNDNNRKVGNIIAATTTPAPAALNRVRPSRATTTSTRIQFDGNNAQAPPKFCNTAGSRYSYAAPGLNLTPTSSGVGPLTSYELLKQQQFAPSMKSPRLKQTYFGGDINNSNTNTNNVNGVTPTRHVFSPAFPSTTTIGTRTNFSNSQQPQQQQQQHHHTTYTKIRQQQQSHSPKRNSSTVAVLGTTTAATNFINRRDQHQPRFVVPTQRRSRSPIKIPWR